jgi:hypothetical protein
MAHGATSANHSGKEYFELTVTLTLNDFDGQ